MNNLKSYRLCVYGGILFFALIGATLGSDPGQDQEAFDKLLARGISIEQTSISTRLSATVTDQEGNPLPGIIVVITDRSGNSVATITDGTGRFLLAFSNKKISGRITIKLEMQGFSTSTMEYDLPFPPPPPPCTTKDISLREREGFNFKRGAVVSIDQSSDYDLYFQGDKLICRDDSRGIATVGDEGSKSLCDINYPVGGYQKDALVVERNVYIFKSYHGGYSAEIRAHSLKVSVEVKLSYHLREDWNQNGEKQ